jgi:hypothetical protein
MPALEAAQARQFLLERSTFDIRLMYRQKSARTRVISQHVRHDLPGDQIEDSDVIHSERLKVVCPRGPVPLAACFEVEPLSSDGAVLWLLEAEQALGLSAPLASQASLSRLDTAADAERCATLADVLLAI